MYHGKNLYINLLFQIIASLRGRSALEWEVTMVITDYLRHHTGIGIVFLGIEWKINYLKK